MQSKCVDGKLYALRRFIHATLFGSIKIFSTFEVHSYAVIIAARSLTSVVAET